MLIHSDAFKETNEQINKEIKNEEGTMKNLRDKYE
jgi:hypothetical protein